CRLPLFLNCLHPRDGGSAGLDDATLLRQRRLCFAGGIRLVPRFGEPLFEKRVRVREALLFCLHLPFGLLQLFFPRGKRLPAHLEGCCRVTMSFLLRRERRRPLVRRRGMLPQRCSPGLEVCRPLCLLGAALLQGSSGYSELFEFELLVGDSRVNVREVGTCRL